MKHRKELEEYLKIHVGRTWKIDEFTNEYLLGVSKTTGFKMFLLHLKWNELCKIIMKKLF